MGLIGREQSELAAKLDADTVQVPAGPFRYGLTAAVKHDLARAAGAHPDRLHYHAPEQVLCTPEF
jgi:hypothetical protein